MCCNLLHEGGVFLTTTTPTGGTDGKHPFAQGKLSTFEIEWPDLGEILSLRVGASKLPGTISRCQCENLGIANRAPHNIH